MVNLLDGKERKKKESSFHCSLIDGPMLVVDWKKGRVFSLKLIDGPMPPYKPGLLSLLHPIDVCHLLCVFTMHGKDRWCVLLTHFAICPTHTHNSSGDYLRTPARELWHGPKQSRHGGLRAASHASVRELWGDPQTHKCTHNKPNPQKKHTHTNIYLLKNEYGTKIRHYFQQY